MPIDEKFVFIRDSNCRPIYKQWLYITNDFLSIIDEIFRRFSFRQKIHLLIRPI